MSENKFIKRLKGEQTAKSVLEIKNESAKTSFANMPQGTSNAIDVFSDHRGNATAVLNGTTNWKVSNSELLLADAVSGDGQDFTSTYSVSGSGLWVNASYTFPSTGDPRHPVAMVFNPSTKWVLKVCGDNLIVDGGSTVDFTMLVKIGTASVYSKNFTIRESAGQFSKEFIIDFGEANSDVIKAGGLSTLTVQLLCGTANASARIYNGMTVLTCLQRKVDASAVSNSSANVEDVLDGNMIPSDYFSNPAFIDQIEDGDTAVAIFARDGDDVNLDHWEQPIPDRTGNAGKFLQTLDGDKMSWENVEISDVTGLQTGLDLKADKATTYTKTETDTLLSGKQDTISDLATIRSNAQAGKAASDTIATYGDIVTHDVAEFATAAQGAKADTALQAGDNVSELVNDAGYLTQHQTLADLGITATASEINVLDGITANTTELNYTDGVTSNIQTQLNNKISYNAIIQNLNSFNNNGKLFLSTLDNCFYSLNRRFTVTGTGFTSFNAAALFDGVFENYSYNNIDVGGTGVITITGSSITGTYRQGYILISFYSGRGVKSASDVTIQIENSLGNVATLTPTTYSSNGLVLIAEVPTLPTANAIAKITITIVNNRTSGTVNPVELEYFCSRLSNIGLLSYVSKTGNSTIYGELTADKLIRSGGTSSQFLKADGSVDSTTYAPASSIPTVGNGTITIKQGGIPKGTFTTNQSGDTTIEIDAGAGNPVWGGIGGTLSNQTDLQDALDAKANTDMDNLTSTGKNISNWSSNVTNCITKIPQDIKLELSNGTLTLKAGSKVYVPNGAGVFDTITIASDLTLTQTWGTAERLAIAVNATGTNLVRTGLNRCTSGTTAPTESNYRWWYDTSANLIKEYSGGAYSGNNVSFPIAIVTVPGDNTATVTSIDQVFNGFGYIGSTVFALPGVKGLIPDGRNADGTLKNNMSSLSSVITRTFSGTANNSLFIQGNSLAWLGSNRLKYLEEPNKIYDTTDDVFRVGYIAGSFNITSGKISDMVVKTVFRAVDYSEADFVVSFQRPTAQNNYTWYRKYKSGWVEQGGYVSTAFQNTTTVSLPVAMADTHYNANAIAYYGTATMDGVNVYIYNVTTSSIGISNKMYGGNKTVNCYWQVSGMAAN